LRSRVAYITLAVALATTGCAGVSSVTLTSERREAAGPAVAALREGAFDRAADLAGNTLHDDANNPQAHLVMAVCRYQAALHQLYRDLAAVVGGLEVSRTLNHQLLHDALQRAEAALAGVEKHLSAAARARDVTLELCLACWERDWNHNGRIDERDRLLLQVELDSNGQLLPEGDPRRRPTFHFDLGDVFWARAMVSFQRAFFNVAMSYRLPELSELASNPEQITIRLVDTERIKVVRRLILAGIDHADRARREYLLETDDNGEWLPNPRQKNHPLPLPVDETLYATWEGVLRDLRALVQGVEGLSVAEVAQLGDHQWQTPPAGFIDIAGLLTQPGDIVISKSNFEDLGREGDRQAAERVLADLFGDKYVPVMKPSPLVGRLARMKNEIEHGQESLARKLRYLLWLN